MQIGKFAHFLGMPVRKTEICNLFRVRSQIANLHISFVFQSLVANPIFFHYNTAKMKPFGYCITKSVKIWPQACLFCRKLNQSILSLYTCKEKRCLQIYKSFKPSILGLRLLGEIWLVKNLKNHLKPICVRRITCFCGFAEVLILQKNLGPQIVNPQIAKIDLIFKSQISNLPHFGSSPNITNLVSS